MAADGIGVFQKICEERFQQFHATLVGLVDLWVVVKVFVKIFAQLEVGFSTLGTILDKRIVLQSDFIDA
ncbi:uncharacterized protein METZ01_LOCUS167522 [marine metagenome]|uniref:Uncharacterized protein n=1 Tax=marine metagenome TaxID=408172 RepID=A0A382BLH2_9ZZZZ